VLDDRLCGMLARSRVCRDRVVVVHRGINPEQRVRAAGGPENVV